MGRLFGGAPFSLGETMTEAAQETETDEAPFRRLNVVPTRICKDCVHCTWQAGASRCMVGDIETSPVTGEKDYVTFCKKKNEDGECSDFVSIDFEGIRLKKKATARGELIIGLLFLTIAIFLFITAVLSR